MMVLLSIFMSWSTGLIAFFLAVLLPFPDTIAHKDPSFVFIIIIIIIIIIMLFEGKLIQALRYLFFTHLSCCSLFLSFYLVEGSSMVIFWVSVFISFLEYW